MKVLIVDDELNNCKLLEAMLKNYGECVVSTSGDDAIERFEEAIREKEPFDLVCLDIMMPQKDGYDVLRDMRKFELGFPQIEKSRIIMVTALEKNNNKVKAFHENCDGYLVKPVERRLLFEMLKKMDLLEETDL